MSKYKESVELKEEEIEMRDALIDELKHRTKAAVVEIGVYKVRQHLEPYTQNEHQYTVECRVNNQVCSLVMPREDITLRSTPMFYAFREVANRMMDNLLQAGAQAM